MIKKELMFLPVLFLLASFSLTKDCGKEGRKASRISGGSTAVKNRYPWMVHFEFKLPGENETMRYGCGGSIISNRHVLTAKHCTEEKGIPVEMDNLKVGVHDIMDEDDFQQVEIEKALYPPGDKHNHDMAILLLKEPLDLSDPKIGKVCLPKSEKEEYVGKKVKSMGWGMEESGKKLNMTTADKKHNFLKDVTLEVADRKEKNFLYTKIIVKNGVHQDPCAGDSGGPLIIKKKRRWTIIGTINGQGYDCRKDEVGPYYGGLGRYNKVTSHLKWIKSVIEDGAEGDYAATDNTVRNEDRCKGRTYGDQECCEPDRPCNEGEGDCDDDAGCKGDLVCRKDNCSKFGPWYHPYDDCCERIAEYM